MLGWAGAVVAGVVVAGVDGRAPKKEENFKTVGLYRIDTYENCKKDQWQELENFLSDNNLLTWMQSQRLSHKFRAGLRLPAADNQASSLRRTRSMKRSRTSADWENDEDLTTPKGGMKIMQEVTDRINGFASANKKSTVVVRMSPELIRHNNSCELVTHLAASFNKYSGRLRADAHCALQQYVLAPLIYAPGAKTRFNPSRKTKGTPSTKAKVAIGLHPDYLMVPFYDGRNSIIDCEAAFKGLSEFDFSLENMQKLNPPEDFVDTDESQQPKDTEDPAPNSYDYRQLVDASKVNQLTKDQKRTLVKRYLEDDYRSKRMKSSLAAEEPEDEPVWVPRKQYSDDGRSSSSTSSPSLSSTS